MGREDQEEDAHSREVCGDVQEGDRVQSSKYRGRRMRAHTINRGVGYGRDCPVALLVVPVGLVGLCSGWAH